jgi:uncharacterized protein
MIAIDTQILVYAHRQGLQWHDRARDRIAELVTSGTRWAIPMHCLIEFYAKVTHRMFRPPSTPEQAIAQIDAWLQVPSLTVLGDDARTWATTRDLLEAAQIMGDQAHDARIAAVCLQHGVTELWTKDRNFLNYPALRVRDPLIDIHPTRASERRAAYKPATKKPASSSRARSR